MPDVLETVVAAVNEARGAFDYVFTTGGIGPTHDDITVDCIAAAFDVPGRRERGDSPPSSAAGPRRRT